MFHLPLDDEQRSRVRDCLRRAKIQTSHTVTDRLIASLEDSIAVFLAAKRQRQGTDRETRDALRELWMLANEPDPPVAQIRGRVLDLPKKAVDYIDQRASHLIPRLFEGETAEKGFIVWAHQAEAQKLVEAASALSAEGGRIVQGRSRGGGKRSRTRFEPLIMGRVRGAGTRSPEGGRPNHTRQDQLVMNVAMDWYIATEEMPTAGRSDRTGFGELVHSIFDWLNEPGATQALRRYWKEVLSAKRRPVAGGIEWS